MKLILAGLPDDTTPLLLQELLQHYVAVNQMEIVPSHHHDGTIAILSVAMSNAEAHWVARRLTGLYWRGHSLRAYVSLFSGH